MGKKKEEEKKRHYKRNRGSRREKENGLTRAKVYKIRCKGWRGTRETKME